MLCFEALVDVPGACSAPWPSTHCVAGEIGVWK